MYPRGQTVLQSESVTISSQSCFDNILVFLKQKKRPLLEQHYRRSHKTQPVRYFLSFVSPSPLFNIKFSVGPQRARVLHTKIASSLRPSSETLQSYAYYNQARSSFYYIIFANAKTTTRFVVVGHLV